jgi:hypothetical protein
MEAIRTTNAQGQIVLRFAGELVIDAGSGFAEKEQTLGRFLNQLGLLGLTQLLEGLDTQGQALLSGGVLWTSKGQVKALIETAFGQAEVRRHVYQTSAGGATRAPLDERAGLIVSSTPFFASIVSSKAAEMPRSVAAKDLKENHLRPVSPTFVQDVAVAVSTLAENNAGLSQWEPEAEPEKVAVIVVGVDGAMINTPKEGWRQALCGTFTLYDKDSDKMETCYVGGGPGATPPEGKAHFFAEAGEVLGRLKARYPDAVFLGISDAASDFTAWLEKNTQEQLIDYHHAAGYLSEAAPAFATAQAPAEHWASAMRHTLRDDPGVAASIAADMRKKLASKGFSSLSAAVQKGLRDAASYFGNHHHKMDYAAWRARNRPIGSGPTEAGCKTIIKQRMTQSGMRWSVSTAHSIISLRALLRTGTRWAAFWSEHAARAAATAL